MGSKYFKHLLVAFAVVLSFVVSACGSKNPNIEELKKKTEVQK